MSDFRYINNCVRLLVGVLVVLSLLCSQGVALHVHGIGHDASEEEAFGQLHSAYDLSHSEDHDGAVHNIDASPDAITKNFPHPLLVLALFVLSALFIASSLRRLLYCHHERKAIFAAGHFLSPPLRAPPR